MASGHMSGLMRFFLWDYPRASWQYDVLVALILAFIFLTPRAIFRDQPRSSNIVRLPASAGESAFLVEPELLEGVPEAERGSRLEMLLRNRFGKRQSVFQLEPVFGNERELRGYIVHTRP